MKKKIIKNAITISMVSMIALNPIMTYGATYTRDNSNTTYSTNKVTTTSRTYTRSTYTKPGYEPSTPTVPNNSTDNATQPTEPNNSYEPNNNTTVTYSNGTVSRTYSRYPKNDDNNTTTPTTPTEPVTPVPDQPTVPTKPTTPDPKPPVDDVNFDASSAVLEMYNLINEARVAKGIEPLKLNKSLTAVAQKKSDDMVANNYLSHQSKTYGSIYNMISDAGIDYYNAGENISKHYNIQTAFDGFMNSYIHKRAILAKNFKEVGIGVTKTSTGMVKISVMFID